MAFKYEEMFDLITNQGKQCKGISESFISQINKMYDKEYSKLYGSGKMDFLMLQIRVQIVAGFREAIC